MTKSIAQFQTISRHQLSLVQSKSTIKCLVDVLEYLDARIADDRSDDFAVEVSNHIDALRGSYPHYVNMAKISSRLIDIVCADMTSSMYYDGTREQFVSWLTITIEYYDITSEAPFDELGIGLTLGLSLRYLNTHDRATDIHTNGIGAVMANWDIASDLSPVFSADCSTLFDFMIFMQVDLAISDILLARIIANLDAYPPIDPVLNFSEFPDLATGVSSYVEAAFLEIPGVLDPNVLDYESAEVEVFNKPMDYYTNHLMYALSATFDAVYSDTIARIRSDVNQFYYKVFDFYTRLIPDNWAIVFRLHIGKLATHTLDIVNLTGLSKSLCNVSLVPYLDGSTSKNRLICSFDNFNPDFTEVLLDGIIAPHFLEVVVTITVNIAGEFIVYWSCDNVYGSKVFDGTSRLFRPAPHFLFISPRIHYPEVDTIRLGKVAVYNTSLTSEQCLHLTTDFKYIHQ